MGLVSWRTTTGLLPCILALLRYAETAFDIRMAKSETKGEKRRTMLSEGWCDRPSGKAKHDFFWDILYSPHILQFGSIEYIGQYVLRTLQPQNLPCGWILRLKSVPLAPTYRRTGSPHYRGKWNT
jgi:hypothetical protein